MVALVLIGAFTVCYVCKKKPAVPVALEAHSVSVPAVTGIAMTSAVSKSNAADADDEKI